VKKEVEEEVVGGEEEVSVGEERGFLGGEMPAG